MGRDFPCKVAYTGRNSQVLIIQADQRLVLHPTIGQWDELLEYNKVRAWGQVKRVPEHMLKWAAKGSTSKLWIPDEGVMEFAPPSAQESVSSILKVDRRKKKEAASADTPLSTTVADDIDVVSIIGRLPHWVVKREC